MNLEQFLLAILSYFNKELYPKLDFETFLSYVKENKIKALLPLLYIELKNRGVKNISKSIKETFYAHLSYCTFMENEKNKICAIINKKKIPCQLYKGIDIDSRFYNSNRCRKSDDVDLLILDSDREKVLELLKKNGYRFLWSTNYHDQFNKNGTFFEIHTALFSYKYKIMFDLTNIDYNQIVKSGYISNELYLLLLTLQHYDEMGKRAIPFVDMFLIIRSGINKTEWEKLLKSCNVAFPLLFCHYYMKNTFGYSPFTDELLEPLEIKSKYKKSIIKLSITAVNKSQTFFTILLMTKRPVITIIRILFPPKNITIHYTQQNKRNFFAHLKRMILQLMGKKTKPIFYESNFLEKNRQEKGKCTN